MPESLQVLCWGVVAFLSLAAAVNHGWHHVRDAHLSTRLARASVRDRGHSARPSEPQAGDLEVTGGA